VKVWIEPVKMVIISSLVWLALPVIVVLAGTSERSFVLFTLAPKWVPLAVCGYLLKHPVGVEKVTEIGSWKSAEAC